MNKKNEEGVNHPEVVPSNTTEVNEEIHTFKEWAEKAIPNLKSMAYEEYDFSFSKPLPPNS